MTTNVTIGIDPGANGAIVVLGESVEIHGFDGFAEAGAVLADIQTRCRAESWQLTAWLEEIPLFAGVNGSAMIKLGLNAGWFRGFCAGSGIACELIRPQIWQAGIPGVKGTKGADRKRALKEHAARLFPGVKVTLKNCDALLIARYGHLGKTPTQSLQS